MSNLRRVLSGAVPAIALDNHPNLLAFYTMDNISGSTLIDETPNNEDGTITGATTTTGHIGANAYSFDGVNDKIVLPLGVASAAKCVTGWVKTDRTETFYMFSTADKGTNDYYYAFALTTAGQLIFDSKEAGVGIAARGGTVLAADTWHHFVIQDEGATTGIYANGQKETITDVVGSDSGRWISDITLRDNHTIGLRDTVTTFFRKGNSDHLRYYDRVLTQSEIDDLYRAGMGR